MAGARAATVVVARTAELDQAAGALIADSVTARNSAIGLLVTRELHGDGNPCAARAAGGLRLRCGDGLVLWRLSRVRR